MNQWLGQLDKSSKYVFCWEQKILKGTKDIISRDPSASSYRVACPIHNGALKTFLWWEKIKCTTGKGYPSLSIFIYS